MDFDLINLLFAAYLQFMLPRVAAPGPPAQDQAREAAAAVKGAAVKAAAEVAAKAAVRAAAKAAGAAARAAATQAVAASPRAAKVCQAAQALHLRSSSRKRQFTS